MNRNRAIAGYALVAAGSALFSSKAIFIKLAYVERPDALLMLGWRMAFALPLFAAAGLYEVWRRKRRKQPLPAAAEIWKAIAIGLIGYYVAMVLDFSGLLHVSAQLERLALFTYPIFLIFIGAAFFAIPLTGGTFVAAIVSYLGLALVFLTDFSAGGANVGWGTILVLSSAISFAVYQLLAKGLIARIGSALFTSLALSGAAVASLAHVVIARGHLDTSVSLHYLLLAAGTGLLATVIPSFFVNAGMARIGPTSTALISNVSPLLTIYFAVILLGEDFTWADALGTTLVIGGVGYHTWRDFTKSAPGES